MTSRKIWLHRAIITLMVWCLCACTVVRLGYNHGEWLAYWWLDNYVGVTTEQRPSVKTHIQSLLAWHRKTQLPEYIRLCALVQKQLQGEVTQAQLLADFLEIKKNILLLVDKALPDLVELALTLTPEQIRHLQEEFNQDNQTYFNEYMKGTIAQRQQFRYEKALQRAEFWLGDFNRAQKIQLRQASDVRLLNQSLHWLQAMQRQNNLLTILKKIQSEKPNREIAHAWLKEHVAAYYEYSGNPERKLFFDTYVEESIRLMVRTLQIATPMQKAYAAQKLQGFMDDFELLIKA